MLAVETCRGLAVDVATDRGVEVAVATILGFALDVATERGVAEPFVEPA